MSKKINISKYEGNTHYSIDVIDSFGVEHHLGYYKQYSIYNIEKIAKEIWANEVKPEEDLMAKAVLDCICLDEIRGVKPDLD